MMPDIGDLQPEAEAHLYAAAALQPDRRLGIIVSICVSLGMWCLIFWATGVFASDWQMVVTEPGKERAVRHIYYDNSGVACQTDSASVAIVVPKGTWIACERLPATRETKR